MKKTISQLIAMFIPFFIIGIFCVMLVAGLFVVSYLFIWGAILGVILYAVAWIYTALFKKQPPKEEISARKPRVYEHKDL